jgi:ABC-type polysaccharide/polyol phosphate export permease
MFATTRSLFAKRDLLYMLTWREIVIKYKQSIMGLLWAIFMPMIIVTAGVFVRAAIAFLTNKPLASADVAAVAVKAVPWAFVVASLRFATNSLISNANLVTKIYMPREIFPLSSILSQTVDFGVACVPLAIILALSGVGVSIHLLWLPVLVLTMVAVVTAFGILLSAGALFFRDVKYLVEVVLTFAIFFTPVLYDAQLVGQWQSVLMLNPIAPILEGFAAVVVRHEQPDLAWLTYSAVIGFGGVAAALVVFERLDPFFAESI